MTQLEERYLTIDIRKLTQDQIEALYDFVVPESIVTGQYVLVREKWSKDFFDEVAERVTKL